MKWTGGLSRLIDASTAPPWALRFDERDALEMREADSHNADRRHARDPQSFKRAIKPRHVAFAGGVANLFRAGFGSVSDHRAHIINRYAPGSMCVERELFDLASRDATIGTQDRYGFIERVGCDRQSGRLQRFADDLRDVAIAVGVAGDRSGLVAILEVPLRRDELFARSPASTTTKASPAGDSRKASKSLPSPFPALRTRTTRRPPSIDKAAASSANRAGSPDNVASSRSASRNGSPRSGTTVLISYFRAFPHEPLIGSEDQRCHQTLGRARDIALRVGGFDDHFAGWGDGCLSKKVESSMLMRSAMSCAPRRCAACWATSVA